MPLSDLVESVCDSFLPLAFDKDVALDLFIDPQVPQQVWSDATRLRQVLCNLVGNAIKFSGGRAEQHGRVSIRVELLPGAAPRLALQVGDNGIGMAPDTLAHLFTAFTQAEMSTTRHFGGTGLGLTICKRLVALMDGELAVCSTLGEGSTFTVSLPVEAVEAIEDATTQHLTDVEGLDCIVIGSNVPAADLTSYLTHGGARVQRDAAAGASGIRRCAASAPSGAASLAWAGGDGGRRHGGTRRQLPEARRAAAGRGGGGGPSVAQDALAQRRPSTGRDDRTHGGRGSGPGPTDPRRGERRDQPQGHLAAAPVARHHGGIGRRRPLEALRLWHSKDYALLLTDLHMPVMDGCSLAKAIRREEAEQGLLAAERMPILALTASALRDEALLTELAGMDDCLTKPVRLQVLEAALEKWLPHERADTVAGELDELPAPAGGRRCHRCGGARGSDRQRPGNAARVHGQVPCLGPAPGR